MRMRRPKGPKRVHYKLIDPKSDAGRPLYAMLGAIVARHHEDLTNARIALAWSTAWKADVDGRCILGRCRKASDLDRELAAFDFILLLSRTFFENPSVNQKQREALLDHELCHAAPKLDKLGDHEEDERGRKMYRIRKHDLEEFSEIAERYGCWKRDLEAFQQALGRSKQRDLPIGGGEAVDTTTGEVTRTPAKRNRAA